MAVKWFKGLYTLNIKGAGEKAQMCIFQNKFGFGECHVGDQDFLLELKRKLDAEKLSKQCYVPQYKSV